VIGSNHNFLQNLGLPDSLDKIDGAMVWSWNGKTYYFSGMFLNFFCTSPVLESQSRGQNTREKFPIENKYRTGM
jgi:hypothetical protein